MASAKTILAISAITTIASSTTVKAITSTKEHAITVITTIASPTNVHAITAIATIASPTSVKATAVVATIESSSGGSRGLVVIRQLEFRGCGVRISVPVTEWTFFHIDKSCSVCLFKKLK